MESESNLENLANIVVRHRHQFGRASFPDEVWKKINILRRKHTVAEISTATGLAKSFIYTKSAQKKGRFLEIATESSALSAEKREAAVVEVKRPDGAELRLRLNCSRTEAAALISGFLR